MAACTFLDLWTLSVEDKGEKTAHSMLREINMISGFISHVSCRRDCELNVRTFEPTNRRHQFKNVDDNFLTLISTVRDFYVDESIGWTYIIFLFLSSSHHPPFLLSLFHVLAWRLSTVPTPNNSKMRLLFRNIQLNRISDNAFYSTKVVKVAPNCGVVELTSFSNCCNYELITHDKNNNKNKIKNFFEKQW